MEMYFCMLLCLNTINSFPKPQKIFLILDEIYAGNSQPGTQLQTEESNQKRLTSPGHIWRH